jgi:hypothetical protein
LDKKDSPPPIIRQKLYEQPSVFIPENLLREARRQKSALAGKVPSVCVLDPDGDIVENLLDSKEAQLNPYWACYHTKMYDFKLNGLELGIIGYTVGAPFAVLVAEELFAHVTNRMGNVEGDFEKGEANGSRDALQLIAVTAKTWLSASGHET